jgi:hypothetical protein
LTTTLVPLCPFSPSPLIHFSYFPCIQESHSIFPVIIKPIPNVQFCNPLQF